MVNIVVDAGWIGLCIVLVWCLGLSVITERWWALRRFGRSRRRGRVDLVRMCKIIGSGQHYKYAVPHGKTSCDPVARAAAYLLQHLEGAKINLEGAIEHALSLQSEDLYTNIGLLSLLAGIAPSLGLLGTVNGLRKALGSLQDMSGLASGLSESMSTTYLGLIVSVVFLMAGFLLSAAAGRFVGEAYQEAKSLLTHAQTVASHEPSKN